MTFYFEPTGVLAERVQPTNGARRQEYVHRCALPAFEEVCHLVDELETFTLEELVARGGLPSSQAAVALRFLHEHGLVEKVHSRRCRRTEDSVHLSAMTCWHAAREGATRWLGEVRPVKVRDLVDRFSEYSEDAEVRLMHQPRYPLESTLGGVVGESEVRDHVGGDLGDDPEIVYLLEGQQLGYGRRAAWEAAEACR